MKAIAYHEAGVVTDADVAEAERAAGTACVHVVDADATWTASTDRRREVVPARRSPEVRHRQMSVVDELADLARGLPGAAALTHGSLDLAEIARYDWYTRLGPAVHRADVLDRLLGMAPSALVWNGPGSAGDELRRVARQHGVDIRPLGAAAPAPADGSGGRRSIKAVARLLAAPKPRVQPGMTIVFAEHFERGARVAARAASTLAPSEFLFVTTTDAATAAARPVGAVPLTRLAGRRARLASLRPRRDLDELARSLAQAATGRSLAGLERAAGVILDGLAEHTAAAWATAAWFAPLWLDVIARARPEVIAATTNAPSAVRAAVAAGRELVGARGCLIQHGLLTLHNEAYLDHDRYLVWGDRDRRALVDLGAAPATVAVTGSPALDRVAERRAAQAGGTETRSRLVLYLPSRSDGRFITTRQAGEMLEAVRTAVEAVPGATLTVKVHPSDRSAVFDDLPGARVVRSGDVLDLIAAADVVVASTSTAGLEACALDRPVLVLAPPGVEVPDDYARYDTAIVVDELDPAVMGAALAEILEGGPAAGRLADGRRALVADVFDGLVPGAAGRIAAELRALAIDHEATDIAVGSRR